MFVLDKKTSFTWPVSFSQPGNGGVQEKHSFDAEFKRLPQSRINKIREEAPRRQKEIDEGLDPTTNLSDVSIADEILVGWDGITDGDKNVPFTKATKKQVLEIPTKPNLSRLPQLQFMAGI